MKIVVAILARENPIGLTTLVGGLHALESRDNEVVYVVRQDDDDGASQGAAYTLSCYMPDKVLPVVGPRPLTLGAAWNEALSATDWDIATTLPNDVVPLTDKWDAILADVLSPAKRQYGVSWRQLCDPTNPVFPAVRREWFTALDNKLLPEWFPFWFSDTWIIEVHQLAFGTRLPLVHNSLFLGGKHTATSGMRDLSWWFDVFAKMRQIRADEAIRLTKHLNIPVPDWSNMLNEMRKFDEWQQTRVPLYEKWFGANDGEPSERYLIAKGRAEEWMKEHGTNI